MQEQERLKQRLIRLMEQPFRVHSEESFDVPDAESLIMAPIPDYDEFLKARQKLQDNLHTVAPELRGFYEEPLINREQEYHWFRQFNFLKHRAKGILQNADPTAPVASEVQMVEKLLSQAKTIKRQLAGCNVRLVMNIAKKQKEYLHDPNIDLLAEIVSDGYMGLMRAVDYFDYRLGNKFSTYATWAILDTQKRSRTLRLKHMACTTGLDETLLEVPDHEQPLYDDTVPITSLLKRIPARQRQVIMDYYGIGTPKPLKLHEIGEKIGLSKERVRQLRERGLAKLRVMLEKAC